MRNLKYSILIVLFFSFQLVSCSSAKTEEDTKIQSFVDTHGTLSVKGTQLVDKNGNPIMLRGVSLGWHNWWSDYYNEETINWIRNDWNANVIRVAIGVDPEGAYINKPEEAMKCLYTAVDAAITNDMYVIIDWHSHTTKTEEAKVFFKTVAEKYKNHPNIIYEIFNEPEEQSWNEVKTYSEDLIRTIRAIDKNNVILVGCPHWDQDIHLVADSPLEGFENIMYTLHFYAATHKEYLRERADYAINKGIPIFISECASMEATGNGPIDKESWKEWLNWMETNKLSWIAWSISSKDETCSMLKDASSPLSGWEENYLKEWGIMIKNTLTEYNK